MFMLKVWKAYLSSKRHMEKTEQDVKNEMERISAHLHLLSDERMIVERDKVAEILFKNEKHLIDTMLVGLMLEENPGHSGINLKVYKEARERLNKIQMKMVRELKNYAIYNANSKDEAVLASIFILDAMMDSLNRSGEYLNKDVMEEI